MSSSTRRSRLFVMATFSTLALAATATWSGNGGAAESSWAAQQELWFAVITEVRQAGRQTQPNEGDPSTPKTPLVTENGDTAEWLRAHQEQLATRAEAAAEDYDRYVQEVRTSLDENRILEALIWADRALRNAEDRRDFLGSKDVKQLVDLAVDTAEKRYQASKWMKAYSYYDSLTRLFENNKQYEQRRRDCLTHARLDAVYKKDGKWAEGLEGIHPDVVTAALQQIDKHYVEVADFRRIVIAGLEQLRLLCESTAMRETFEGLADEELREQFRSRVNERLIQVRRATNVSQKDVADYFRRALKANRQTIQLPEELVVYEFVSGSLEPLDEFTSVIWPVEFREFDKHTRGDFIGVGISITGGSSRPITVVTPLEDAPAYREGIQAGDLITHVNGESLEGISLTKAVQMITGPIDTWVTLTIHRPSEQRDFDVPLKRALVEIQSVKGCRRKPDDLQKWDFLLDSDAGVGYIGVNSFQENTVDQLHTAIDEAQGDGMRGLILDLRFNPGGLLKSAVEMTQLFLNREDLIVETRGLRDKPWRNAKARHDGPFTSLPLIVLVNEHSASASEIVSGALQDHGRGIILGERTFGKFSVQKLMQLIGGGAHLKLTTARYYLPSGRSLHHDDGASEWGIMPDVEVSLVPKEVRRILSMKRE
ncbi:MAG: PDZ domain-containing protein, partial [Planctomycetes bacterium]|nr:PDZ domain-containing protein [Planctomycetota bacterium]